MIFINGQYPIIDSETGEIINYLNAGDKIIKGETIEYLQTTVELENNFIKIFTDNMMPVIEQLKDGRNKVDFNALSLMFYLIQFISYKSGLLQHPNGKPLTTDFIINDFSMNRTDIYRCLKLLKDKQIIAIVLREDRKQYYMFNPFIAIKGKRVDKTSIHTFLDTQYVLESKKSKK